VNRWPSGQGPDYVRPAPSSAASPLLRDAALALLVVMENGIYFGYEPGERAPQGEHWRADAIKQHRSLELVALANLRQALNV
jgi:hypothetical protein